MSQIGIYIDDSCPYNPQVKALLRIISSRYIPPYLKKKQRS